ncbi:MAG TPA: hypothetical protein VK440_01095 [Burkholderiales bacterium]|nr:hypothetical protein [Burkholderiales bacterium]
MIFARGQISPRRHSQSETIKGNAMLAHPPNSGFGQLSFWASRSNRKPPPRLHEMKQHDMLSALISH